MYLELRHEGSRSPKEAIWPGRIVIPVDHERATSGRVQGKTTASAFPRDTTGMCLSRSFCVHGAAESEGTGLGLAICQDDYRAPPARPRANREAARAPRFPSRCTEKEN